MEIEPRPKVIVLKRCEMRRESPGGIVIPESVKEPNSDKVAMVYKIGSDIDCVKEGDIVAFSPAYVNVVELSRDNVFVFCEEKNILAILK